MRITDRHRGVEIAFLYAGGAFSLVMTGVLLTWACSHALNPDFSLGRFAGLVVACGVFGALITVLRHYVVRDTVSSRFRGTLSGVLAGLNIVAGLMLGGAVGADRGIEVDFGCYVGIAFGVGIALADLLAVRAE